MRGLAQCGLLAVAGTAGAGPSVGVPAFVVVNQPCCRSLRVRRAVPYSTPCRSRTDRRVSTSLQPPASCEPTDPCYPTRRGRPAWLALKARHAATSAGRRAVSLLAPLMNFVHRSKRSAPSMPGGVQDRGVLSRRSRFAGIRRHLAAAFGVALCFLAFRQAAVAMNIPSIPADGPQAPNPLSPLQRMVIWTVLFLLSSALHAAEISITTLYPWKVKEFAAEEGANSPFRILDKDITRVLTTVLVATTACTIYSAAIFTSLAGELLGARGVAYSTVALTVVTLIFGELIPKSLGVSSAELVARTMVPPINLLAVVLSPVGKILSLFAKLFLRLLGLKTEDDDRVSEEQLRLLIAGAQKSGGIGAQEGRMINAVLNMQKQRVSEAMCPRVDVAALDKKSTLQELQEMYIQTKYSRIPVYDGNIDNIIGVVMSKDLLEFVFRNGEDQAMSATVESIMQPTYFVPETMTLWTCLQEMRQRRVHMAVVVDEYGGTAGIITLEDIQEEVFGEIYDEEDKEEEEEEEDLIRAVEDGTYLIQGSADLEDVFQRLGIEMSEDDRGDFATFGGYLCALAGEIPAVSDHIVVPNYIFTITQADERRILEVKVVRIVDDGVEDADGDSSDLEQGRSRDDGDSDEESPDDVEDWGPFGPTRRNRDRERAQQE